MFTLLSVSDLVVSLFFFDFFFFVELSSESELLSSLSSLDSLFKSLQIALAKISYNLFFDLLPRFGLSDRYSCSEFSLSLDDSEKESVELPEVDFFFHFFRGRLPKTGDEVFFLFLSKLSRLHSLKEIKCFKIVYHKKFIFSIQ